MKPFPSWQEIVRMTPVQLECFKDQCAAENRDHLYPGDLETAAELQKAGWTPEPPSPSAMLMSYFWRRPPLPGQKKGRLYKSPTQALNALRKFAQ